MNSQAVRAEELLVLRQYDQAADVATTLLKTSHYSTEADVQQSRERAATVLVQAFEEQSRDTETVPLLSKLYGSLLDAHISAILLWIALALQSGKREPARVVLEQHINAYRDQATLTAMARKQGERASRLHSNHQLMCQIYASEILAGDQTALQALVQRHRNLLDAETQATILGSTTDGAAGSALPGSRAAPGLRCRQAHQHWPAAAAAEHQPASHLGNSSESAAGPATPVVQEQAKQPKASADGPVGSAAQVQHSFQAAAEQSQQQAAHSSAPVHSLPAGPVSREEGRASQQHEAGDSSEAESRYVSWTIPLATACAGVIAYAAFHERRALSRGGDRLLRAATSGLGDAFSAGMRVTPNSSGARAMYSRL